VPHSTSWTVQDCPQLLQALFRLPQHINPQLLSRSRRNPVRSQILSKTVGQS